MINVAGETIIPGDLRYRHLWAVCGHYHEKCPWALGDQEECDLKYNKNYWIDISGQEPHCPFSYREQL